MNALSIQEKIDALIISKPDERYHAAADGFRALSMLGVMWYHIWQQSWLSPKFTLWGLTFDFTHFVRSGYLFVDVFLLLSGFLMFMPYAKSALDKTNSPSIKAFYVKRAARILPPYYLCIFILFIMNTAGGEYYSKGEMIRDLLSHLTLTHVFFTDTYLFTHLNVPLWTIAIEAQFYLIFPFVARAFKKFPIAAYLVMVAFSQFYRFAIVAPKADTQMYLNQLPAMLDVYANGMLAAYAYVALAGNAKPNRAVSLLSTLVMVFIIFQIHALFEGQTYEDGYTRIRLGQMERRFPLSFLISCLMIVSSFSVRPLVSLFSNRIMRFLSAISFEAYIWHTVIALRLKKWRIPAYSALENPQMNNEPVWQWKYTLLCFALALLIGAVLTYAYERPLIKRIARPKRPKEEKSNAIAQ